MKIEEIAAEWGKDGKIDTADIIGETANTPYLHNKYFQIYVAEGIRLKQLRNSYKQLYKLKLEYYRGQLDPAEVKELGWPLLNHRYLKQDVQPIIEADQHIIDLTLKIGIQEHKVEYLESIIKQIGNRGYQLKNIIDWSKFTTGN